MAAPSTTPPPTLPTDWAPTSRACLQKDDYWIWDYGASNDARTVIGSPSQITDCFSPSWNPTVTFAGSACPLYYTSACHGSNDVVTCCPQIEKFTCQPQTWGPGSHAGLFRCESKYTSEGAMKVTRTIISEHETRVENRTKETYDHLCALALMYTTPVPTASLAIPFTTDTSLPGEKPSGLTPGASAGIGIGAAVFVILLALLVWFIYRRRKAAAAAAAAITAPAPTPAPIAGTAPGFWPLPPSQYPTPVTSIESPQAMVESFGAYQHPTDPLANPSLKELPGDHRHFELDNDRGRQATAMEAKRRWGLD